jgi:hypothetical protein
MCRQAVFRIGKIALAKHCLSSFSATNDLAVSSWQLMSGASRPALDFASLARHAEYFLP